MQLRKAVVIGGGSGIGLAIAKRLAQDGYRVEILDRQSPEEGILPEGICRYHPCDLLELDEDQIAAFAKDPRVTFLMITAGFGRVAAFEDFHTAEIERMMTVNATSTIRVLRLFYDRIRGKDRFYCGVMGSVAGLMSSPLAAVYAASKAAICRFLESVNIELEMSGTENRVLNASPASFPGSRFNGGENRMDLLEGLAGEIVRRALAGECLYIPRYEETFRDVLARYHEDPHAYGLHSYRYKLESGRVRGGKQAVIGYLSGTFDLFHVGHLNLLRRAKQHCDYLIVGVHGSGAWKGKETFIPFEERKQIVSGCKYVDKVVDACVEDSDAWELWRFDRLFVGSDYKGTERFERYEEFFRDKGVEIVYFPYTQGTSSTEIRKTVMLKTRDIRLDAK